MSIPSLLRKENRGTKAFPKCHSEAQAEVQDSGAKLHFTFCIFWEKTGVIHKKVGPALKHGAKGKAHSVKLKAQSSKFKER